MATNTNGRKTSEQKTKSKSAKPAKKNAEQGSGDEMLRAYFIESVRDIFWAEKKLVTAIPKMQKAATSEELKDAFAQHLVVTKQQVERLSKVFGLLEVAERGKKCEGMEGLVNEAEESISSTEEGSMTRDVALIIAAQKVEHYEIAAYGGLTAIANVLGEDEIAGLLEDSLAEEKEADELLTSIAEEKINYEAVEEEE